MEDIERSVNKMKSLFDRHLTPNDIISLVANGADVNEIYFDGKTPLHFICGYWGKGDIEVVKALVELGADVNIKDYKKISPLHVAVEPYDNEKVVEYLLDKGAKINEKDIWGMTPLHRSVYPNVIRLLISRGADTSIENFHYRTPLQHSYTLESVKALVESGVDINFRNYLGHTALHYAYYKPEIAEYLISKGAME